MSHYLTVQAVKIKIEPVVSGLVTHSELGVFVNEDDTQEIRWSESALAGVAETWTTGIISKNGIGDIKHSGDTRQGGCPEEYSGFDLKVLNNNQLILRMKELGISVSGLKAILYEYIGTESDSDASTIETRAVGTCEYESGSTWDENIWNITIKSNRYQRNAFLGTQINNDPDTGNYPDADDSVSGEIVPATIGQFEISDDGTKHPAKLLRTAGEERQLTNSAGNSGRVITPENLLNFPVVCNFIGRAQGAGNPTVRYVGCGDLLVAGDVCTIYNTDFDSASFTVASVTEDTYGDDSHPAGYAVTFTSNLSWTGTAYIIRLHSSDETESPNISYVLQLGITNSSNIIAGHWGDNITDNWIENLVNKWVKISVGGGYDGSTSTSLTGKYNKITRFNVMIDRKTTGGDAIPYVTVVIGSFFEKNLSCNPEATATNQPWVSLWEIPFEFTLDTWPCAGFIDEEGVDTTTPHLYSYVSSDSFREKTTYELNEEATGLISKTSISPVGFKRISQYGYTITELTNNNVLIINALLFKDSPENLLSYDIFPFKNFTKYIAPTLEKWGMLTSTQVVEDDNLYTDFENPTISEHTEVNYGGTNPIFDKSSDSYLIAFYKSTFGSDVRNVWLAHEIEIDIDKILMEYDAYYLGIDITSETSFYDPSLSKASGVRFGWRRFLGLPTILEQTTMDKYYDSGELGVIKSLPDFYYINDTYSPENNKSFYFDSDTTGTLLRKIFGVKKFALSDFSTKNDLSSIYKILLLFNVEVMPPVSGTSYYTKEIYYKELSLICETSASISTEVYSLCKGRIFNDTWGSRKTATDLIQNPVDVLEHFKRLQCGIDIGDVVNYGKAYSPSMPIKTGVDTIGSYDDSVLDDVKEMSVAYQIHDSSDAWTDTQIKKLCKTFGLCTYTDLEGNECVTTLDKIGDTHTLTEITFPEIYPESIGETQEAEAQDVFCQPIFNYMYNYGSGSYDKQLAVTNIQASTWNSAYTPGFDPAGHNLDDTITDGQMVWNACKTIYNKYRQIEECSSDFSDQEMIADYTVAVKILYQKILWMGKPRVPLSVYYDTGKNLHYGQHIKIKLPHQTNNYSVECFVEEVKKSKYNNKVDLTVVTLEDIPTLFF